jgi:hypothetical protein
VFFFKVCRLTSQGTIIIYARAEASLFSYATAQWGSVRPKRKARTLLIKLLTQHLFLITSSWVSCPIFLNLSCLNFFPLVTMAVFVFSWEMKKVFWLHSTSHKQTWSLYLVIYNKYGLNTTMPGIVLGVGIQHWAKQRGNSLASLEIEMKQNAYMKAGERDAKWVVMEDFTKNWYWSRTLEEMSESRNQTWENCSR